MPRVNRPAQQLRCPPCSTRHRPTPELTIPNELTARIDIRPKPDITDLSIGCIALGSNIARIAPGANDFGVVGARCLPGSLDHVAGRTAKGLHELRADED